MSAARYALELERAIKRVDGDISRLRAAAARVRAIADRLEVGGATIVLSPEIDRLLEQYAKEKRAASKDVAANELLRDLLGAA